MGDKPILPDIQPFTIDTIRAKFCYVWTNLENKYNEAIMQQDKVIVPRLKFHRVLCTYTFGAISLTCSELFVWT